MAAGRAKPDASNDGASDLTRLAPRTRSLAASCAANDRWLRSGVSPDFLCTKTEYRFLYLQTCAAFADGRMVNWCPFDLNRDVLCVFKVNLHSVAPLAVRLNYGRGL